MAITIENKIGQYKEDFEKKRKEVESLSYLITIYEEKEYIVLENDSLYTVIGKVYFRERSITETVKKTREIIKDIPGINNNFIKETIEGDKIENEILKRAVQYILIENRDKMKKSKII